LISSYVEAVRNFKRPDSIPSPDWGIIANLFLGHDAELDDIDYQSAFNGIKGVTGTPYSAEKAEEVLQAWLKNFGYDKETIIKIAEHAHSQEIADRIHANHELVDKIVQTKGIPTTIYDGKRHIGVYRP
jgi:hypothetical protein